MPVPDADYQTAIALRPPNQPQRGPYYRHAAVGGNTHVLALLQAFSGVLGIDGSTTPVGFDEQMAETRALLNQQSAALSVARLERVGGDALEIDVTLSNLSGHKLPTAYPSRRMWLHLRVPRRGERRHRLRVRRSRRRRVHLDRCWRTRRALLPPRQARGLQQ